jgi:hypothetical protein
MTVSNTPFPCRTRHRCGQRRSPLTAWLGANRWLENRRYRQGIAVLGVCLLHLLFFLALHRLLGSEPETRGDTAALQVRLIDDSGTPPAADVMPMPVPSRRASAVLQRPQGIRHVDTRPAQSTKKLVDVPVRRPRQRADSSGLFDKAGRVILPDPGDGDRSASFSTLKQPPEFAANPLDHVAALPYRSTRFNRRWVPDGETLAGAFVRKATLEKHWDTRAGNRIQCAVVVIIPACLWGWIPRVPIEELQAMRADPPMPRVRP